MIRTIYMIILIYFALGGVGFYFINRKKDAATARKSYIKYLVYFAIINILFFSITIQPFIFHFLTIVIILAGFIELSNLFVKSNSQHLSFFIFSIIFFSFFSFHFFYYGMLRKELSLLTFLIISIFDSFSQVSGQLFGHRKILPSISPNKTWEGLAGGAIIAIISAFLLEGLYVEGTIPEHLILTIGTIVFAFAGDILASLFKRKYQQKDFNNLILGHGGFLDRFDSLIAGGAWAAIYFQFIAT
ncbi:MAG: phosphatidate cytidylyltransferase [Mariniphaga sp.]|nr:phosphatidate cytidylyltransferase [Mariniphaga sp.]